jgi:hypothetical protein
LFLRGSDGRRPVLGNDPRLQHDPRFRDHIPFHEYFHGDTGCGLGASHQTGWTGLVALLLQPRVDTLISRSGQSIAPTDATTRAADAAVQVSPPSAASSLHL